MNKTFQTYLAYGEALEKAAAKYVLPKLFPFCDVRHIGKDKAWRKFGADFLLQDKRSGKMLLVEVKADFKTTGNIVIENYSSDRKTGEITYGWLHTSKADYLLYISIPQRKLLVIDFAQLRWMLPKLNLKEAATQINPGYVTHLYLLRWNDAANIFPCVIIPDAEWGKWELLLEEVKNG